MGLPEVRGRAPRSTTTPRCGPGAISTPAGSPPSRTPGPHGSTAPTHGVRQVHLPWAEPRSRFTTAFERFAIDVLKETDISGAANILKTSWDECWGDHGAGRRPGPERPKKHQVPALIGVDEKAASKGHSYLTLVYDIAGGTVEYIADDRKQASLDGYFETFSPEERDRDQSGGHGHVGALHQLGHERTSTTPRTRSSSTASTS